MLPELQDLPTPGGETKERGHLSQAELVVNHLVERSRFLEAVHLDEVHGAVLEQHDDLGGDVVHLADHTEVSPLQTNGDSLGSGHEIVCEKELLTVVPYFPFPMFVLV